MLVREKVTELLRDIIDDGHPEDHALVILISRAVERGDQLLARGLSSIPRRSAGGCSVLMEEDCPALARIAAVCDPIETLAWRRALVHASVRGDRRRVSVLHDLAARRCAE